MSNITEKERQDIIDNMADEAPLYVSEALYPYISEAMEIYANKRVSELRNAEKPSEDLVQQIEAIMGDFYNYANNERKYYYDIRSEHAVKIAKLFNPNAELLEALKCVQVLKDLLEYPSEVAFDHIDEAKAVHSMFQKVDSAIQKYEKP